MHQDWRQMKENRSYFLWIKVEGFLKTYEWTTTQNRPTIKHLMIWTKGRGYLWLHFWLTRIEPRPQSFHKDGKKWGRMVRLTFSLFTSISDTYLTHIVPSSPHHGYSVSPDRAYIQSIPPHRSNESSEMNSYHQHLNLRTTPYKEVDRSETCSPAVRNNIFTRSCE